RTLLGAGAAAVAGVAAGLPVRPALAKAPQLNTQAPYFYRFRIGSIEATVVSDGALPLGEPSASFLGTSKEEVGKMLTEHFFPAAQIYMSQADLDYWTDEAKLSMAEPKYMKPFVEGARKNLLPNRDRIVFVKDGQEVVPGIQAIAAPGHTVGHTVYMITSGKDSLAAIGDTTHHQVLLFEKPLIEFAYDTDSKKSSQTRVRILDMLASSRTPLLAYHFPWPGIGHAGKQGDGFRWHPAPMEMTKL